MVTDKQKKVTPLGSPAYIEDRELYEKVRRKRRRGLTRRLAAFFILVGVAAVMMTSVVTAQQELIAQKEQKKASYEQKLSQMEKQEHILKNKIQKLNDLDYIGKIARRDYFLTRDGETIFTTRSDEKN
ncbi:MAG TPA: septum formation initiator family protein [Bacillales bacterium]